MFIKSLSVLGAGTLLGDISSAFKNPESFWGDKQPNYQLTITMMISWFGYLLIIWPQFADKTATFSRLPLKEYTLWKWYFSSFSRHSSHLGHTGSKPSIPGGAGPRNQ